jgi:hypothetical protein
VVFFSFSSMISSLVDIMKNVDHLFDWTPQKSNLKQTFRPLHKRRTLFVALTCVITIWNNTNENDVPIVIELNLNLTLKYNVTDPGP